MHDFEHLAMRQEHGIGPIVRQHQAVTVAMRGYRADNQREFLSQTVLVAAISQHFAGVHRIRQRLLDIALARGHARENLIQTQGTTRLA